MRVFVEGANFVEIATAGRQRPATAAAGPPNRRQTVEEGADRSKQDRRSALARR